MTVSNAKKWVVLGTGGTIAGRAASAADNLGYTAAQVGVADLLANVPGLQQVLGQASLCSEQVAQVDSKDMRFDIWLALAQRVVHHLAQPDVGGVLITHGTDTLEETAYFLQAVLPPELINTRPVVLTCAMRPATSLNPDGPQNLLDAAAVAQTPGASGVLVVCAGSVHTARDVQKSHTYRLDAFSSGDCVALGYVEEGQLRRLKSWPRAAPATASLPVPTLAQLEQLAAWPRVELVMSHAGCTGDVVDALLSHSASAGVAPLQGLVVAGTGNGTIHHHLEAALRRAQLAGVRVLRTSRCANGRVLPTAQSEFADAGDLSPAKARIALMLALCV